MNLDLCYKTILKDGLRDHKYKNSHLQPVRLDHEMRGAIFAYRSKKHMIQARGLVLTSVEGLSENNGNFTHWTPNIYRFGSYSDEKRQITRGHSEENLRQINTFYIDFDITSSAEEITVGDILTASLDLGFMPTLILKSDHGYQAYFALKEAAYVTRTSKFQVVKVAKAISQNLRNYFAETLPVDLTCNHFGIARIPSEENVEFFDADYMYSFQEWLEWSMKQSELPFPKKKSNLSVISGTKGIKQIDEPWYQLLLQQGEIKGHKDLMGRNNALFTLALANFSSGVSQGDCEDVLGKFNGRLLEPLSNSELEKIIRSAYSGKYEAANRDYILILCRSWIRDDIRKSELFITQGWYKFKKRRSLRKNSHLHEWEADVMAYLNQLEVSQDPFLQTTKKKMREEIGVPERSFDKVLNSLKEKHKILFTVKAGRNGGLRIASVRSIALAFIQAKKEAQSAYLQAIAAFFEETVEVVTAIVRRVKGGFTYEESSLLFEVDTG